MSRRHARDPALREGSRVAVRLHRRPQRGSGADQLRRNLRAGRRGAPPALRRHHPRPAPAAPLLGGARQPAGPPSHRQPSRFLAELRPAAPRTVRCGTVGHAGSPRHPHSGCGAHSRLTQSAGARRQSCAHPDGSREPLALAICEQQRGHPRRGRGRDDPRSRAGGVAGVQLRRHRGPGRVGVGPVQVEAAQARPAPGPDVAARPSPRRRRTRPAGAARRVAATGHGAAARRRTTRRSRRHPPGRRPRPTSSSPLRTSMRRDRAGALSRAAAVRTGAVEHDERRTRRRIPSLAAPAPGRPGRAVAVAAAPAHRRGRPTSRSPSAADSGGEGDQHPLVGGAHPVEDERGLVDAELDAVRRAPDARDAGIECEDHPRILPHGVTAGRRLSTDRSRGPDRSTARSDVRLRSAGPGRRGGGLRCAWSTRLLRLVAGAAGGEPGDQAATGRRGRSTGGARSGCDQRSSRASMPTASVTACHMAAASRRRRGRSSSPTSVAKADSAGPPEARRRRTVSAMASARGSSACRVRGDDVDPALDEGEHRLEPGQRLLLLLGASAG